MRVLIVDDQEFIRRGIRVVLADAPEIEVCGEAKDGVDAIEKALQLLPDVVLMDISMPEMTGIEATRMILAERPAVRVIGLSMFEENEQAKAMREAGAVAYLTKSGASEAVIAAIRTCVGVGT